MSYDQFYESQPNGPTAGPVQTSAPSPTLPPSMGTPASAPVGDGTAPIPVAGILAVLEDRYDLAFPIKAADGSDITFLKLRRLKAKEMKGVDPKTSDGKFGGALKFIAEMNGLPADTLDELDAVDVIELVGKVAPFFGTWHWRDAIGLIAHFYHFPPSEMWEMDSWELDFWANEASEVIKAQQRLQGSS